MSVALVDAHLSAATGHTATARDGEAASREYADQQSAKVGFVKVCSLLSLAVSGQHNAVPTLELVMMQMAYASPDCDNA